MIATHEDSDGTGYCRGCGTTIGEHHHRGCEVLEAWLEMRRLEVDKLLPNQCACGHSHSNVGLGVPDRINAHLRQLAQHMMQRDGVVLLRESLAEIERLNLELQKRDKCSFMGPMRDCPTHGESEELKKLRTDNAQLQFALEQSEAKFLTPNV